VLRVNRLSPLLVAFISFCSAVTTVTTSAGTFT
jgi:hypothetical protein